MTDQERKVMEMALKALEHVDRFDLNRRFCFDEEIDALHAALAQGEQAEIKQGRDVDTLLAQPEPTPFSWNKGYPPKHYAEEWFIAITVYGDRVVLKSLAEGLSYDFTTVDATYMAKENVKCWMQFPDSEYVPFNATPPSKEWVSLTDEQIDDIASKVGFGYIDIARGVEAALKELNHG